MENYIIFILKGSGGEPPGRWRIFEKTIENSKEKFKKFEFYYIKFQCFYLTSQFFCKKSRRNRKFAKFVKLTVKNNYFKENSNIF